MVEKGYKEEFAKFFEDPDRTKFRDLLKQNTGEYPHLDFKEKWLEHSKLAKHVLGFANSGGGILVFGVKEESDKSLTPSGINSLEDKTGIKSKLQKYLPPKLEYEIIDFEYNNDAEWGNIKNKKFQVLIVEDTPQYLPFLSLKAGSNLEKNRVYYRGKTNTEEATHDEIQKIFDRRMKTIGSNTKYDVFKEHLDQLKLLFYFLDEYERNHNTFPFSMMASFVKGPGYPKEDYRSFLIRMIKIKTELIENITKSG